MNVVVVVVVVVKNIDEAADTTRYMNWEQFLKLDKWVICSS